MCGDEVLLTLTLALTLTRYVAMRYWYPFTSDALEAIKRDGIERLVVVPLYPQFSISTSGSSLRVSNPNPNPNPN